MELTKVIQKDIFFDICEIAIEALEKQKELNPDINNITCNIFALSDVDGQQMSFNSEGPGANLDSDGDIKVKSITLDSFMKKQEKQIVNFIKMDIEGSEIPALRGAVNSIREYKPKLAISAYHKWDDLRKYSRNKQDQKRL